MIKTPTQLPQPRHDAHHGSQRAVQQLRTTSSPIIGASSVSRYAYQLLPGGCSSLKRLGGRSSFSVTLVICNQDGNHRRRSIQNLSGNVPRTCDPKLLIASNGANPKHERQKAKYLWTEGLQAGDLQIRAINQIFRRISER